MNNKTVLIVKLIVISLCILAAVFSSKSHAASVEMTFGGLTYHTIIFDDVSQSFNNKISSDGRLIYTGLLGVGLVNDHLTARVFIGQNSIGDEMFGSTLAYSWDLSRRIRLGPVLGFYQQDDMKYILKGIKPFSLGFGIVPIVGAELNIRVYQFENNYISLNTVITPVIINETISLGIEL